MKYEVLQGDCREVMATLDAESVDAIVSDPPYGLSFMGKGWDHSVPGVEFWEAALRVAKPGAHLLAFGGTRLFHRLAVAIEDAGWEIRDTLMWVYGSGFPKSHNGDWGGTALKPAWEPIIMARKPLIGTVAANFERHNVGGLNIDGCRVGTDGGTAKGSFPKGDSKGIYGNGINGACDILSLDKGRWPANLIHDGSEEATDGMGEASRYFYCAKASKRDRDEGLEGFDQKPTGSYGKFVGDGRGRQTEHQPARNHHPTVKPTDLMAYLCRLVTPKGGIVLDPFCGSGSTGKAAVREGFEFLGIEMDQEYCDIARARIEAEAQRAGVFA
jgi:site-specific DNA-methyltransferase (adenine-specific)